jgi:hypothetical protein
MPVIETPMRVEWNTRSDGSAWVSVGFLDKGSHFQCDYFGDMALGPQRKRDFSYPPPEWVIKALNLKD